MCMCCALLWLKEVLRLYKERERENVSVCVRACGGGGGGGGQKSLSFDCVLLTRRDLNSGHAWKVRTLVMHGR